MHSLLYSNGLQQPLPGNGDDVEKFQIKGSIAQKQLWTAAPGDSQQMPAHLLEFVQSFFELPELNRNEHLSLMMFAFCICFNAGFIGCYGGRAFRRALFPLLFLIFLVP